MLPIVLVLLVATSGLAAPTIQANLNSINDVAPQQSNGRLVGSYLTDRAFEISDGGDNVTYVTLIQQVVNDLANARDPASNALAVAQALAILSQLSAGVPGDACAAAEAINAYVGAVRSGRPDGARRAISGFIQSLASAIDAIVLLSSNPNAARFAYGPRGQCNGGGRTYQFEAAWDSILSSVPAGSADLLNESYCNAKRLYGAFSARSNNVGAYVTAVSLPPVNLIFQRALEPVARFLSAVAAGNAGGAAGAAKQALIRAANSY